MLRITIEEWDTVQTEGRSHREFLNEYQTMRVTASCEPLTAFYEVRHSGLGTVEIGPLEMSWWAAK